VNAARAFAKYRNGGTIIVGTDTRSSRALLKEAVIGGLSSSGCNIFDAGIIPTPTLSVLVREFKADGGIMISASHNPEPQNGLKFINERGLFLNQEATDLLRSIFTEGQFISAGPTIPKLLEYPFGPHLSKVLGCVDVSAIAKRSFVVALDSVNGAGSLITQRLLKDLGCRVLPLYCDPEAGFPRAKLEPTPDALGDICEYIKRKKADIGFVQDPDADRLAIVSEKGVPLGEEYTLALAVAHVLKNKKDPRYNNVIATNLSTTQAIDDIARTRGAEVVRTKIGEINVAEEMIRRNAIIGGEGNGGVIYPPVGHSRDSLIAIALLLEFMALSGKVVSELREMEASHYDMIKTKIACHSKDEQDRIIKKALELAAGKKHDTTDGVKIFFSGNSWIHVRASNTEHAVRVIVEARDLLTAENLLKDFEKSAGLD
jgi:phosphomannomutase